MNRVGRYLDQGDFGRKHNRECKVDTVVANISPISSWTSASEQTPFPTYNARPILSVLHGVREDGGRKDKAKW
jgi:hypothetical protein